MKLRQRKFKLKKIRLQKEPEVEPSKPAPFFSVKPKNLGLYQITPNLFMSGYNSACDLKSINKLGISHIINLTSQQCPNSNFSEIEYSSFCLSDNPEFDLMPFIDEILSIIITKMRQGKRVLVHCKMGISRAPSIIIAFLIKSLGMTYEKAFDYILNINSRISPNLGYLMQLEDL